MLVMMHFFSVGELGPVWRRRGPMMHPESALVRPLCPKSYAALLSACYLPSCCATWSAIESPPF